MTASGEEQYSLVVLEYVLEKSPPYGCDLFDDPTPKTGQGVVRVEKKSLDGNIICYGRSMNKRHDAV